MNNIKIMTDRHRTPRNCGYVCRHGTCFGPRKSLPEALNHRQRETLAQIIDRRLEEAIGCLKLPSVISTGFLYVMDAAGQHHKVTMDMAHSFEVCLCVRYAIFFFLHLLKFPAIYRSS